MIISCWLDHRPEARLSLCSMSHRQWSHQVTSNQRETHAESISLTHTSQSFYAHIAYLHQCLVYSLPSILVYGSVDTAAQCLLTFRNPMGCPVLCLKHSGNSLFAGLRDGTVLVYQRRSGGKIFIWCPLPVLRPLTFAHSTYCTHSSVHVYL